MQILSQSQGASTRSRCYINGVATSLRVLRELGSVLVDTNGQHSSQSLKEPHTQLALLDRIAGETHELGLVDANNPCIALATLHSAAGCGDCFINSRLWVFTCNIVCVQIDTDKHIHRFPLSL